MKQSFVALSICVVCLTLTGCAYVASPVTGLWYTNVTGPITATGKSGPALKTGSATATSVLGLIASGNASIRAAALAGGITEIHYVDYHAESLLGIYAKFTVTVYGTGPDGLSPPTEIQEVDRQQGKQFSRSFSRSERIILGAAFIGAFAALLYIF